MQTQEILIFKFIQICIEVIVQGENVQYFRRSKICKHQNCDMII